MTPKEDGVVISVNGYDIIVTVKPTEAVTTRTTIESVRSRLTEYLEELNVTDKTEGIIIMPKGFLGRDRFALIATIVEELGGRYISEGKESRFLIPKD